MDDITILPALPDDLHNVLEVLNDAAGWLHEQHIVQWPERFRDDDFRAYSLSRRIKARSVFLLWETGTTRPIATCTVERHPDRAYWNDDAQAWYLHRMAVRRSHAGRGLGRLIIAWAAGRAWRAGADLLRLECSRHNHALQRYYRQVGFRQLPTIVISTRHTGARFEMSTQPMAELPAVRDLTGDTLPGDEEITTVSAHQLKTLLNNLAASGVKNAELRDDEAGTRVVIPYTTRHAETIGINDGAFVWGFHQQYWHPVDDPDGAAKKIAEHYFGP